MGAAQGPLHSPPRLLLLGGLLLQRKCGGEGITCQIRFCLPPDTTQWPPLCYTEALSHHGLLVQNFAACPAEAPHCDFCLTELPCESFCLRQPLAMKPLGSECEFDEECAGDFSRCLQRVCRRALQTHQLCNVEDPNDVCHFGRRTCFRGRCQGLSTGELCSFHPEGPDIDCMKGWHCAFGVCTPQLPEGHSCSGQHPNECLGGHRCNQALPHPRCAREHSLELGELSSDARLCKSNYVSTLRPRCSMLPPTGKISDDPRALDCAEDAQCIRSDGSLGRCVCKRWWDGVETPGYCEYSVQDTSRPAFKRFWEAKMRLCHQNWPDELCAKETDLVETLKQINTEEEVMLSDPTEIQECGRATLATPVSPETGAAAVRLRSTAWLLVLAWLPIGAH